MREHQSKLEKDKDLSSFYKRINPGTTKLTGEVKTPKISRRATKGKEDIAALLGG